jgi:hypothetical protein
MLPSQKQQSASHKVEEVFPLEPFGFIALDLNRNGFHEAELRPHEVYDFLAFRLQGIGREKP